MICAIAAATYTHPDQWWRTDEATLATMIDILESQED